MYFKVVVLSLVAMAVHGWPSGEPGQQIQRCQRPHEKYVDCYLAHCGPKACSERNKTLPCASVAEPCEGGCVCEEGYLKNFAAQCVPEDQCPVPEECHENEEYTFCLLANCNPKTCQQKGVSLPCPSITLPCKGGCLCKEGWLRNEAGKCIPEGNCN